MPNAGFWRKKPLADLSQDEWEALCDGCAKCCLVRFEDEDTGDIATTRMACRLLDHTLCRCSDYGNRLARVPGCAQLTADRVAAFSWLPETCAYRLVANGHDLPWWHHLVSGSRDSVHEAGQSVRGKVVCETQVDEADWEDHVIDSSDLDGV